MEAKGETQWSSIIVPSVQEMVKEKMITTVPPRYVQSDQENSGVTANSGLIPEIPIIDMKRLCSSTAMDSDSEVQKLDLACKEFGFFQLVNHGTEPSFLDKTKLEIQDFFNLPLQEKKKFWQQPDEMEGFGQGFVMSEDQKLDWSDVFFFIAQPAQLRKPHLFPKLPLPLRDTLEMYSAKMKSIAKILIAKMGEALQIKPEELVEKLFGDGDTIQTMRINYYPPCPEPHQVIGVTPHSDAAVLTILLQVSEVEGLQIKKDGNWVFVKPLPNAFIVNVGDVLEIISNGTYKSIEHRVVVNSEKERLSFATFHNPGLNKEISPAKSLVEKQNKGANFRSLLTKDYLKGFFSRELYGKAYLDSMRI